MKINRRQVTEAHPGISEGVYVTWAANGDFLGFRYWSGEAWYHVDADRILTKKDDSMYLAPAYFAHIPDFDPKDL